MPASREEQALREIRAQMLELRDKVVASLARGRVDSLDLVKIRRLLDPRATADIAAEMEDVVSRYAAWSYRQSIAQVDATIRGLKLGELLPADRKTERLVKVYNAGDVTSLMEEHLADLSDRVAASFLGMRAPGEAVALIQEDFGVTLGRAETIVRTEGKRLSNFGSRDRMEDLAPIADQEKLPLVKRWLHSSGSAAAKGAGVKGSGERAGFAKGKGRAAYAPRMNHVGMHGVAVPLTGLFELPAGEYARKAVVYKVDGPYDPALPPEECVNCYCDTVVDVDSRH